MSDYYSNFLYAEPSFVEGFARALDLGAVLNEYNSLPTGEEADCAALAADLRAIGLDFNETLRRWKREAGRQRNGLKPQGA